MIVTPQNISEIMFAWKQQNALEKSTAAVKKDENGKERRVGDRDEDGKENGKVDGVRIKYKEETSLSFMLAVWKTEDLIEHSKLK